jgi:hypothetical protein
MTHLLFLDFDGVLNNTGWFERQHAKWEADPAAALRTRRNEKDDLDPDNMAQLTVLARRVPPLQVVVSSSWRCGRSLADLRDYLAPAFTRNRVIGVTPRLESRLRHEEITHWLKEHQAEAARYLAFDDDTHDMTPLGANFVHVHREKGLTAEHVEAAVDYFLAP